MSTKQILINARDTIIRQGWCQGSYADGPYRCIHGALNEVTTGDPQNDMCLDDTDAITALCGFTNNVPLAKWNDTPGRTSHEVISLFNKAIEST